MLRAGREHFPSRVGRGRGGGSEISTVAPVSWGGPGYAARRKQTAVKIHFHTCGAQAAP